MLQFQRYDQGRIFCDLVKVSLSHKKSEINDISKILACLSMQQFAILSWQLAKIISCKDISSKNYYFNIGKQLWIVISDNVWQYMKHVLLFCGIRYLNFWSFQNIWQNSAFLWVSVGLLTLSWHVLWGHEIWNWSKYKVVILNLLFQPIWWYVEICDM